MKDSNKGITLIALIITIIVLLILAAISVGMLRTDNSILKQSRNARDNTEKAKVIELAKTDIFGKITENQGYSLTKNQLKTILDKYFEEFDDEMPYNLKETNISLTAKDEYGGYTDIALSDIYDGLISSRPNTSMKALSVFNSIEEEEISIYYDDTVVTWQDFLDSEYSNSDWTTQYLGHGEYHLYYKNRKIYGGERHYSVLADEKIEDYSKYYIESD